MQRERRRDPYPWTWEIPLAITVATLLVVVLGIQLGRSVANLLAGAGWTWPDPNAGTFPSPIGTAFWTSLPGVLGGHADAGLPTPTPDGVRSPPRRRGRWSATRRPVWIPPAPRSCPSGRGRRRHRY